MYIAHVYTLTDYTLVQYWHGSIFVRSDIFWNDENPYEESKLSQLYRVEYHGAE